HVIKLLWSLAVIAVFWSGMLRANCAAATKVLTDELWYRPTQIKGGVLFVHGLNNHHRIFESLARDLQQKGFLGVTFSLTGHESQSERMGVIAPGQWQRDFWQAYCRLRSELGNQLPIKVVSF